MPLLHIYFISHQTTLIKFKRMAKLSILSSTCMLLDPYCHLWSIARIFFGNHLKFLLISYVNCPVVTCNNISTVGRSLTRVSNSGGDDLKNHILDYLFPKVPYIRCIFVSDTRFYQVWQDTYNITSDKSVSCMNLVLFHELQSNSTFEAEWFCIWYRRLFPI